VLSPFIPVRGTVFNILPALRRYCRSANRMPDIITDSQCVTLGKSVLLWEDRCGLNVKRTAI
jgi:hypothetical protein